MITLDFRIKLLSDAHPGTGLGGETVNDYVPRDHRGRPVLNASHIKGLMRAELSTILASLGQSAAVIAELFGIPDATSPQTGSRIRLTDATAGSNVATHFISRTAIGPAGTAADQSLRTQEAIPVGTLFSGKLFISAPIDSSVDLAARLSLLSIRAVGGSRNRGSGQCLMIIEKEERTPGELLKKLLQQISSPPGIQNVASPGPPALSAESAILRLDFEAWTPVCCPEHPAATNMIISGFTIPASTVQGALLTLISTQNPGLATALFESAVFRAWPLLPYRTAAAQTAGQSDDTVPVHVSLTHRVAKFSINEKEPTFVDSALDDYDWREVAHGAPLKAADGVLLRASDGQVRLWKAASMPHIITTHGVQGSPAEAEPNLFTVDAMAPMHYRGLLVVPANMATELIQIINESDSISIGKARSIRGTGRLKASFDQQPVQWQTTTPHTVLVVQSPLALPDTPGKATAEEEFRDLIATWATNHGLPQPDLDHVWPNVGLRFGWNRHSGGRSAAVRVILPGSVVAFSAKIAAEPLKKALTLGVGSQADRQRGFGALSVHPGKATSLFSGEPAVPRIESASNKLAGAMKLILGIHRQNGQLPSRSQIRAVEQKLRGGKKEALEYIDQQTKRTSRIWFTWQPIYKKIEDLINNYPEKTAREALHVLAELAAGSDKKS